MRIALPLALCLALPSLAHAQAGHEHHQMSDLPLAAEWAAINDKMHAGMGVALTGEPDVDFVKGMIPHHEGAVEMAELILAHGTDPEVRKLAEAIIAAQETEIAWMRAWLAERGH